MGEWDGAYEGAHGLVAGSVEVVFGPEVEFVGSYSFAIDGVGLHIIYR